MKKFIILLCLAGISASGHAQLSIGSAGSLTITSATSFYIEGLTLSPSANLTLQNTTINVSATPVAIGSGNSIASVYTITPALSFSGAIGIRYTAGQLNSNQENTLSMVKSGATSTFTSVPSNTGGTGSYYVMASGLSNVLLNKITATSTAVPLPIHYQNMQIINASSCTMQLSWQADGAKASDFNIERSEDGKNFQELPASVSQSDRDFKAIDRQPLPGRNFYRLAIREAGSPVYYSTVLSENNSCTQNQALMIYPNPAKGMATLSLANTPSEQVTIKLTDLSGKVIRSFQTTKQVSMLQFQGIIPGHYLLQVQNGTTIQNTPIILL
ncbi:hypothetical protein DBR32_02500 [Taibaiella sp. KBW10]|uniref:T9SS type A sorting domain-containing protein n=1 Tax=Taibaiella sp. KBW10 TaxID=2153357 RepID=UPI000F5A52C1|nr:T9SS type A sorting domain-containing protein [Taibaiella sp. KBW10]RQO32491.1 hypothetical protein DBR32_02500 [Taibaiella sp. KBW10]